MGIKIAMNKKPPINVNNDTPKKINDGKVICVQGDNFWHFELAEVTSQSKVYKEALHRFFRQSMPLVAQSGEFEVEININVNPEYPAIDVDNVAKAVLDGLKGHVFIDDAQIMRLLVEKEFEENEKIGIDIKLRQ